MRILIVNCVYNPEPVVSAQIGEALARTLAAQGNEVNVIAPYPSRPNGFNFDETYNDKSKVDIISPTENLFINRLPSFVFAKSNPLGRLFEGISFGWASYKYIKKNASQIDKVYMNTWPLFGQLGVAKACKKNNIPYIVHIQDVYPESLTKKIPGFLGKLAHFLLFPIEKYVTAYADRIVVISNKMKQLIATTRNLSEAKIEVVLNWQDEKGFEPYKTTWPNTSELTFMYLGNIGPVAGLPLVIKSFITSNIKAKLVIAGSGAKKESCMAAANSHPAIEFWDVPAGEVAATQAKAHILLLPMIKGTASSSIPSKLPAYMCSSRPIIASVDNGSDTSNAVLAADCGWVGEAEDEQWLIETFKKVSNVPNEKLKILGANGYNYCAANFSKTVNLNKLLVIINNGSKN